MAWNDDDGSTTTTPAPADTGGMTAVTPDGAGYSDTGTTPDTSTQSSEDAAPATPADTGGMTGITEDGAGYSAEGVVPAQPTEEDRRPSEHDNWVKETFGHHPGDSTVGDADTSVGSTDPATAAGGNPGSNSLKAVTTQSNLAGAQPLMDSGGAGGAGGSENAGDSGGARGAGGASDVPAYSPSRFAQVVELAQSKYGAAFGSRASELLSPNALMWLSIFGSLMAVAEMTPAGWVVDGIGLAVATAGAAFIGKGLSGAVDEFKSCVALTQDPNGDLDSAAEHLANGVSMVTVNVFFALLGPPKAGSSPRLAYSEPVTGFRQFATQGILVNAPEEAFADTSSFKDGSERTPMDASDKVAQRADGKTWRLNRKNVANNEKVVGDPESVPKVDANREALAAELAAGIPSVERVFLGEEANRYINGQDQAPSVDAVAVNKNGDFYLYECKGGGVTGALTQIEYTASTLGPNVKRATLVLSERISEGGDYSVVSGKLQYQGKEYRIDGRLSVNIIFTTQ